MSKTKYLQNRCLCCGELLHASTHQSEKERDKRDAAKIYCGGPCAAKYKATQANNPIDTFIYAGARK